MGGGKNEERMGPDGTGEDGDASDEVCTVTAIEPGVDAPIVSPNSVIVTAVLPAMDDEAISESTMAVAVGTELVAVTDVPLIAAVCIAEVAKKPLG
jgi:hypothetical protein